ncbi:MAG: hypothetical protein H7269_07960, partial [Cellulomonas sp.]|nr:hypothetical protein [Cellulomonas sp.]
WTFLAYRLSGRRLPAEYDPWLWDDVTRALYSFRRSWSVLFIVTGAIGLADGPSPAIAALAVWTIFGFVTRGYVRREALSRYFPPAPPMLKVFGPEGFRHVPRGRVAARPVLGATALVGLSTVGVMLLASRFAAPATTVRPMRSSAGPSPSPTTSTASPRRSRPPLVPSRLP